MTKLTLLILGLVLALSDLAARAAATGPADGVPDAAGEGLTNIVTGPVIQPIDYPPDEALTPRAVAILKQERTRFAQELRTLPRYRANDFETTSRVYELVPEMSAEAVEAIITELDAGAANTPRDNNARFRRALSARIPVFKQALTHFEEGQYMVALDTSLALTKEKILLVKIGYAFDTMPPYCYCAVKLFQAEAYGLTSATRHCLIANQIVYNKLPLSVSFAPTARIRAADLYARSDRTHYAIVIYQGLLEQQAMNLVDTELLRLRVATMRWMRGDPYRVGSQLVSDVTRRVSAMQFGDVTRANQTQLVNTLAAMIMLPDVDENWFGENSMRLNGQPIEGARLQKGGRTEKFLLTNDVAVVGTDDWGSLRPREKQELIQMFSETYSARYREMLEAYYRGISIAETGEGEGHE